MFSLVKEQNQDKLPQENILVEEDLHPEEMLDTEDDHIQEILQDKDIEEEDIKKKENIEIEIDKEIEIENTKEDKDQDLAKRSIEEEIADNVHQEKETDLYNLTNQSSNSTKTFKFFSKNKIISTLC
jgi:hypothetical protein